MQNESTCSLCARHFMNTVEPNPSLPLCTLKNNSLMVAILLELSCSVRYVMPKPPCPSTRSILYFPPCKVVFCCRCCIILLSVQKVKYNMDLLTQQTFHRRLHLQLLCHMINNFEGYANIIPVYQNEIHYHLE